MVLFSGMYFLVLPFSIFFVLDLHSSGSKHKETQHWLKEQTGELGCSCPRVILGQLHCPIKNGEKVMENVSSQHAGRSVSALAKGEQLRSSAQGSPASRKVSRLGFMRSAILGCLLFMVIATSGASAQYVAVDMTPAGLTGTLAANSAGVQGGQAFAPAFPNGHAFLLNGDPNGALDVHPAGWYNSQVLAAAGNQEVGFGLPVASADATAGAHALLWFGYSTSFTDLTPANWGTTLATCTNGFTQGGYGIPPKGKGKATTNTHALIWSGSASTAVDMNPAGIFESRIYGCADTYQAGYVMPTSNGITHAAVWSGSAASVVDLHPAAFMSSMILGVAGTQQAGSGVPAVGNRQALLWSGSAASVVNLHPDGYSLSLLYATNGTQQAGQATDNGFPQRQHAMAWTGTAGSAVDLNQFLPAGYTDASARAIDAGGNIVGFASQPGQASHMLMWVKLQ
jgi:hypothetical protein